MFFFFFKWDSATFYHARKQEKWVAISRNQPRPCGKARARAFPNCSSRLGALEGAESPPSPPRRRHRPGPTWRSPGTRRGRGKSPASSPSTKSRSSQTGPVKVGNKKVVLYGSLHFPIHGVSWLLSKILTCIRYKSLFWILPKDLCQLKSTFLQHTDDWF